MNDNVTPLPVRFKQQPGESEPLLKIADHDSECNHKWYFGGEGAFGGSMRDVQYLIREGETEVECGHCGKRLDPMFVLRRLASEETKWHNTGHRYREEMERLSERKKTRCRKCGHMTTISRAKANPRTKYGEIG